MFEIDDSGILSPAQKFTGFFDKKHHKAMASNTSIQNNAAPDAIKFSGFTFLLHFIYIKLLPINSQNIISSGVYSVGPPLSTLNASAGTQPMKSPS